MCLLLLLHATLTISGINPSLSFGYVISCCIVVSNVEIFIAGLHVPYTLIRPDQQHKQKGQNTNKEQMFYLCTGENE